MPGTAEAPAPDRRHRRVYVYWAVSLGLLAALGLACWLLLAPFLKVRAIAEETGRSGAVPVDAIERLGGRQRAAAAIGLYFRVPRRLSPDRMEACCILSHCGPHIMPVLRLALADEDAACRATALQLAAHMGRHGSGVVPQATDLLGDKNREVRFRAATALGVIAAAWAPGPVNRRQPTAWSYTYAYSPPGFLRGLRTPNLAPFQPGEDTKSVPLSREVAARAATALARAMSDSDEEVRSAAAQALVGYIPDAVGAVPGLVRALESDDEPTRTNASALLAEIGPAAGLARPALIKCLEDRAESVRRNTVIALGQIVDDKLALRDLFKTVADDPSEEVRKAVAKTLATGEGAR